VTRIVAGSAGGRRIAVPPGQTIRPTSERVREALFSTLETLLDLDGARVLDLYAGSGAVGLEALSRGAAHALLVESDARTARLVRDNARSLGLSAASEVRAEPVRRVLAGPPPGLPYQVVFADPPYALPAADLDAVLADLAGTPGGVDHAGTPGGGWLAAGAVVVLERPRSSAPPRWPAPLVPGRCRRYGDAVLWYGHAT
jgi:16S rRNA (guanine966-N2)-methyltransferase